MRLDQRLRRQRAIAARAKDFDLGALLLRLEEVGIAREDITFQSNSEPTAQGQIVESVEFFEAPSRRATVTLNLGLTGPNALLPSYFQQIAEESRDADLVFDFLHFFDHPLLDAFVDALYPDRPTGALRTLPSLTNAAFSMLGVGSVSTLQWLFTVAFPELRVEVRRDRIPMLTDAFALHAGMARLDGTGVLGLTQAPHSAGLRIDLYVEEEENNARRQWIDLVEDRWRRKLQPVLRPYALTLKVVLTVFRHKAWARLENEEGTEPARRHPGHLGYDRIQDEEAPHEIVVFEGAVHESPS